MENLIKNKKKSLLNTRLTQFMEEKNMNLSTLSQKAGISIGTVQKMLTDPTCNPTISSLDAICNVLDISISQLIGQIRDQTTETHVPLLSWETLTQDLKNFCKITSSKNNRISTFSTLSEHAFALKIIESSMMPIFPMGTTLIFDRNKSYYHGCYVLAYLDQGKQHVFKRLLVDEPYLYIKSINPDLRENMPLLIKKNQIIATLAEAKM